MSFGIATHRDAADGLLRLVANSLPLLVWISGPDKRCTYFNKSWLASTGRPLEAEIGDGWVDGVHAADLQHCLATYVRAFDRREPFMIEYRLRRNDGQYRWMLDNAAPLFDAGGSFAGYIGACFDVTDLRGADAERRVANERLRLAMESLERTERELKESQRLAGVGSWQWDRGTGEVVWSEELYRIAGRDPGLPAVSYEEHPQLYPGESWHRLRDAVERALETGAPYELVLKMARADGTHRWVTARGEVQLDAAGRIAGLRGTVQDITERKLAEEAVSSMNGRLIEAQESERARIARELHDDIGQRLALLVMSLEQAKGLLPDSSHAEAVGFLDALQTQTGEIIADVQALAHELHPPRLLHLGLVAAMRGLCEELSGQTGAEIDFRDEKVPGGLPPDLSLCFFRVLQEALHNAVRHSRAGHFGVHLRGTGDALDLTVRDEGVGFDVDAAKEGLGLGLASMKERLKLVSGELFIESHATGGTTVVARAPVRRS
jgi:PAS domain S-box-containing protein